MTNEDAMIYADVLKRQTAMLNKLIEQLSVVATDPSATLTEIEDVQERLRVELDYSKYILEHGRKELGDGSPSDCEA